MSIASKILKVSALSSEFYILEDKNMARLKGLTDEAKISPRLFTRLTAKQQKRSQKLIKNKRILALLPFIFKTHKTLKIKKPSKKPFKPSKPSKPFKPSKPLNPPKSSSPNTFKII